jgi:uncharacterized protein YndB with AHSA1/START domain
MSDIATPTLSLVLTRHFDAPPERVFDAWVGKEWGAWLGQRSFACTVVAIDPRVGGAYRIEGVNAEGVATEMHGAYLEMARPSRLVFTWQGGVFLRYETIVTLTFEPDGAGTLMTLRHEGFRDDDIRARHQIGWAGEGSSFDRLAAILAKGAG